MSSLQSTIWPGEPVLMMLDDLESQWKRGRLPNLLQAMELVMLALLNTESPDKVCGSPSQHFNIQSAHRSSFVYDNLD